MKKKIGISYTPVKMANYLSWFNRQQLDDQMECITLSYLQNNTQEFNQCDAFILTGGDDIDPSVYGGHTPYPNMPHDFHSKRDVFEEQLFRYAEQHHKPLLGICRGLQMINVILGGKLIQDAGEKGNAQHKSVDGIDKEHEVTIVQSSLLFALTQTTTGMVNSAHHQLADVQALGTNLMVNSLDQYGYIEGLEYADKTNKPFMLGVQWHPERMPDQQNVLAKNIIHGFLKAIPSS